MIPTMHSPVPHHLPVRRTSPRRLLAALCVTGLALSGCSFGKDDVETSPKSPGDDSAASSEAADAPPAIVEDEGFYRANTLQEPIAEQIVEVPSPEGMSRARLEVLSLDSDGTNARMVLAWLPPTDGPVAQPDELVAEAQSNNSRPWVRLVDLDKRTLTEPLQLDSPGASFQGNEPVASQLEEPEANPQRKGAAISSYAGGSSIEAGEPDATDLIYIDFPAPESEKVTVLAGDSIAPLTDVPVSSQQPFDAASELAQFRYVAARDGKELPGYYGASATRMRSVPLPMSSSARRRAGRSPSRAIPTTTARTTTTSRCPSAAPRRSGRPSNPSSTAPTSHWRRSASASPSRRCPTPVPMGSRSRRTAQSTAASRSPTPRPRT